MVLVARLFYTVSSIFRLIMNLSCAALKIKGWVLKNEFTSRPGQALEKSNLKLRLTNKSWNIKKYLTAADLRLL